MTGILAWTLPSCVTLSRLTFLWLHFLLYKVCIVTALTS